MTVITKSLGEKKSDNLQEPLVENIVVEHADEGKRTDVEAGGYPNPPPHTTRYIISARVRPYYSLMFILMLVLLVATSLLGIFGTEYLYEQYKYFVGSEQKPEIYRAWGTLSYDDEPAALPYENKVPARFERNQDPADSNMFSNTQENKLTKQTGDVEWLFRPGSESASNTDDDKFANQFKNELKEEFELDLDKNYEKINVPSIGTNRFIHDFYSNYTAVVDVEIKRCFVMPLDRSVTLPPKSLYDLIYKMSDGYYSLDTEKIRRDMRIKERITDTEPLGIYINKECKNYAIYKLEKIVSGVTAN